jgi:hypothetical protein
MEHEHEKITPLAVTNWRDIRRKFGIKQKNRRGHMYILGKTGTGKSTLIANMVIADMKHGHGLALIDPHGDLAETVLRYVPKERMNDVVYFNPGDLDFPIGLNLLEGEDPRYHYLIVSGLISVFKKFWSEYWGPRMEHIFRHALFTLLEAGSFTLLDVAKLLNDYEFRQQIVGRVSHPEVRKFWDTEFERYSKQYRQEMVAPILNKLGQFLTSLPIRNIVGQQKSGFKIRDMMDQGKILIANLSKGLLGEDGSALLGAILVTKIHLAALSRSAVAEPDRHGFYLYVDEVHNFLTLSFADILSEARKYGLNLILAHQYGAQLDKRIQSAILGNAGSLLAFRLGHEDAEALAPVFRPVFQESDLMNTPNFDIRLKLMIDGVTSDPFSATTLPLPEMPQSSSESLVRMSRARYARPRERVESELLGGLISTQDQNQLKLFGS